MSGVPLLLALLLTSSALSGLRGSRMVPSWLEPADPSDQLDQGEQAVDEHLALTVDERPGALAAGRTGLGPRGCYSPNCLGESAAAVEADLYAEDLAAEDDGLLLAEADRADAALHKRTTEQYDATGLTLSRGGYASLFRCKCLEKYAPLDFGDMHYPRSLNAAVCVQSPGCEAKFFPVPVLTHREKQSLPSHSHLPDCLRTHWRVEYKDVPVACECVPLSRHLEHGHHGHHGHIDGTLLPPNS